MRDMQPMSILDDWLAERGLADINKHLPGGHDQASHGRRGGQPGKSERRAASLAEAKASYEAAAGKITPERKARGEARIAAMSARAEARKGKRKSAAEKPTAPASRPADREAMLRRARMAARSRNVKVDPRATNVLGDVVGRGMSAAQRARNPIFATHHPSKMFTGISGNEAKTRAEWIDHTMEQFGNPESRQYVPGLTREHAADAVDYSIKHGRTPSSSSPGLMSGGDTKNPKFHHGTGDSYGRKKVRGHDETFDAHSARVSKVGQRQDRSKKYARLAHEQLQAAVAAHFGVSTEDAQGYIRTMRDKAPTTVAGKRERAQHGLVLHATTEASRNLRDAGSLGVGEAAKRIASMSADDARSTLAWYGVNTGKMSDKHLIAARDAAVEALGPIASKLDGKPVAGAGKGLGRKVAEAPLKRLRSTGEARAASASAKLDDAVRAVGGQRDPKRQSATVPGGTVERAYDGSWAANHDYRSGRTFHASPHEAVSALAESAEAHRKERAEIAAEHQKSQPEKSSTSGGRDRRSSRRPAGPKSSPEPAKSTSGAQDPQAQLKELRSRAGRWETRSSGGTHGAVLSNDEGRLRGAVAHDPRAGKWEASSADPYSSKWKTSKHDTALDAARAVHERLGIKERMMTSAERNQSRREGIDRAKQIAGANRQSRREAQRPARSEKLLAARRAVDTAGGQGQLGGFERRPGEVPKGPKSVAGRLAVFAAGGRGAAGKEAAESRSMELGDGWTLHTTYEPGRNRSTGAARQERDAAGYLYEFHNPGSRQRETFGSATEAAEFMDENDIRLALR